MLHARALPDNPYDGHTLRDVIDRTETLTGCAIERAYVDKGYRGHDAQNSCRIFISGQKRGVFGVIKRELRRRSAIEPIIGHLKADGHLGRCYLRKLLRFILIVLWRALRNPSRPQPRLLTDDQKSRRRLQPLAANRRLATNFFANSSYIISALHLGSQVREADGGRTRRVPRLVHLS